MEDLQYYNTKDNSMDNAAYDTISQDSDLSSGSGRSASSTDPIYQYATPDGDIKTRKFSQVLHAKEGQLPSSRKKSRCRFPNTWIFGASVVLVTFALMCGIAVYMIKFRDGSESTGASVELIEEVSGQEEPTSIPESEAPIYSTKGRPITASLPVDENNALTTQHLSSSAKITDQLMQTTPPPATDSLVSLDDTSTVVPTLEQTEVHASVTRGIVGETTPLVKPTLVTKQSNVRPTQSDDRNKDINMCVPNPCQNNGTCLEDYGYYRCQCPYGFTGYDCETDISGCPTNPFMCYNGECIEYYKVCDSTSDCSDSSDENGCVYCGTGYRTCGQSGQCIPTEFICDGHVDCSNNFDEVGCSNECSFNEFSCDGTCLQSYKVCDNYLDCRNGSDEVNCDIQTIISNNNTFADEGSAVFIRWSFIGRTPQLQMITVHRDGVVPVYIIGGGRLVHGSVGRYSFAWDVDNSEFTLSINPVLLEDAGVLVLMIQHSLQHTGVVHLHVQEIPCYPVSPCYGGVCSSAGSCLCDAGYTGERCQAGPPLFDVTLRDTAHTYSDVYEDPYSLEYQQLEFSVSRAMNNTFATFGLTGVILTAISNGSIICKTDLTFGGNSSIQTANVQQTLNDVIANPSSDPFASEGLVVDSNSISVKDLDVGCDKLYSLSAGQYVTIDTTLRPPPSKGDPICNITVVTELNHQLLCKVEWFNMADAVWFYDSTGLSFPAIGMLDSFTVTTSFHFGSLTYDSGLLNTGSNGFRIVCYDIDGRNIAMTAGSSGVFAVHLNTAVPILEQVVFTNSSVLTAVAYHDDVVYWSNPDLQVIGKTYYGSSVNEVVFDNHLEHVISIRIDTITGLLYWIDASKHTLEVASIHNLQGTRTILYVYDEYEGLSDIALDPVNGYAYVAGMQSIYKSHMDGQNMQVILQDNSMYNLAITVDLQLSRVYWYDPSRGYLESCDMNGGNRTLEARVQSLPGTNAYSNGLTLDADYFYLTDMYLNRIVRIERNGHGTLDILQTGIPFPSKISVYNADTISQGTNDCVMILNGGCPDDKLCVPVPNGISCVNITGDELPTCGGDIVVYDGSSVTLTSPNYPNNYNNEDDCEWIVKAYPGGYIHVRSTHFNTEECCDFLHIGYGDHEAVTQSGFQYQYVEWTSPVSTIWIRWNSDSSVTRDGWALVLTHTYSSPSASPYPCPEGYAPCWNNAECYPSYEQCNDNCYCSDCSDENNCSPSASPYPCPEGYMSCWYTDECYPSYEHCNNNCYCSDCSDENNCYAPTTIPPPMCGYGCLNGGYCSHSYDNYYTCSCPIDYTGMFCETEIKHCEDVDVMCLNGGTCMYDSCYCPAGYTGSLCETELFDCNMFGCFSGNCTTYGYCICWPGYTGHLCETVLPTCDSCSPFAHCDYAPCECICTDYNCTNQYQCMNNQCIPWSEYCDGNNDCLDGSDEWYCYPVSTPSPYCPAFHSPCSNYIECVPNEAMCNGTAECSDKSDEFNCGCGGSNHIPNGKTFVMTSPGYPDNYGNNDLCYWYISADAGATISIHFEYFDTESNFDFISIGYGLDPYDISTRVIYQSGSVAPDDWLSPTSNIWISWDSDGSFYQKGWVLSVIAREACTESINLGINEVVSITSPNYPLPYDDLIDCVWIVQADPTRAIDVHFIAFNTNYDEDYFSGGFGDDPDDLSTQAFIYSGDVSPPDWNSESTLIWLRFTTDGSNTNTGFHIDLKDDFYCENIGIPQCVNHLPYGGSTFYSHLGLSREQAMKQMDNLTDIDGCHAHIELFMCSLLSPECGINGTYRQPCKTFCQDVEYACAEVYVLNGYDWPINCEDMPTKNERYDCVRVTPCMSNPCVHGGTCLPVDEDSSTCACSHGYTGEFCELEIDECSSNPCENGGICIDMLADYTCVCPHGWGGTRCDCRDITVETCRDMPLSMARLSKYTSGSDRSGNIQALVNFLDNMRYNRAGTPCHEHMDLFMCALFAPECSEEGLYRPPCMHFCDQVKTSCETKFNTGGIAWPIDCDLLPHTNDSSVCIGIPTVNDLCGSAPAESNRIVGGSAASLGTHPWQVSIHEHSAHNCGAVLIDSNWIVTAAHCVYSSSVSSLELRMGVTSLSAGSVHEYRTPVSAMYIHPSYSTTFNQYDFAMLYVETPIIFTDYIRPICLPPDGNDAFFADGDVCVITGWGQLSETSYGTPDVLQEAVVPIVNQGTCNDRYGGDISSSMICAAYLDTGGIDTCYGDSGGPLVSQKTDGRWYLAGLTSWGRGGCASSYYPGVYSRVTEGIAWMNEIMASEP